jgi:hypothetical protein
MLQGCCKEEEGKVRGIATEENMISRIMAILLGTYFLNLLSANIETWRTPGVYSETISKSFWHSGLLKTVQYYEPQNNCTLKLEGNFSLLVVGSCSYA